MGTIPVEGKAVVIAVAIAAVLSAAGGGGSAAFFLDSTVSQDNSIRAADWTKDLDLKISPNPIETGSQGNSVQLKVAQPSDGEVNPATVDVVLVSESLVDDPQTSNPEWSVHTVGREALIDAVDGDSGSYTVIVSGELEGGGTFEASAEVTVKTSSQTTPNSVMTNQTVGEKNETNDNTTAPTGNETVNSGKTTMKAENVTSAGRNTSSGGNLSSSSNADGIVGSESESGSVGGNSTLPDDKNGDDSREVPSDAKDRDGEDEQSGTSEGEPDDSTDSTETDADSGDDESDTDEGAAPDDTRKAVGITV
jgi:hypothetical protein